MNRVCSNPACTKAGQPQPATNFRVGKLRCTACVAQVANANRARRALSISPVDQEQSPILDVEPIRVWLQSQVRLHGDEDKPVLVLAAKLGVSERELLRLLIESKKVRLDTVDRALTHYGHPYLLRELYPELYVECSLCERVGTHADGCPDGPGWRRTHRPKRDGLERAA